jgi:phage tail sheath protein FI
MAKRFKTPGVFNTEIDLSEITAPTGTSVGGIVIRSTKGPINRMVTVTSDKDFIDTFGEPVFTSGSGTDTLNKKIPEYGYGAYSALEFLNESDTLNVLRVPNSGDSFAEATISVTGDFVGGAGITASATQVEMDRADNIQSIEGDSFTSAETLLVASNSPGTYGNNIAIAIEVFSSACEWINQYDDYSASLEASAHPIASQVFRLDVYTKKDNETFNLAQSALSASNAVETYFGTLTSVQDGNKNNLNIVDQVNGNSKYIYVKVNPNNNQFTIGSFSNAFKAVQLSGGAVNQGNGLTSTDGWNHFAEKENVDVDILIVPTYSQTVKQYVANNVVANRKDCIMVAQSGNVNQTSVSDILTSETYGYTSPSYVALYAGWDQIYDSYNDVKVFVPKCIFGASVMARTDTVANVWDAPAGTDRGVINAIDQNKVYTETEIGLLYDKNINTSKLIRGVGHVLWGQKTAQLKKSALDRINVRRNLLFIEKTIERSLQVYVLNVNNNESTRLRVFSNLDSFLATVRSRGGLIAYQVVVDESNNTSTVIDNNQLAVDVYVQPAKTVEFIDLQTIVTRTGVNFAEVVA